MNAGRSTTAVLVLALLLASAPLSTPLSGQTRVSIVGGPVISTLTGDGADALADLGSRTGVHVGVLADLPLFGSRLSIAPGGLYVEKGFTQDGGDFDLKLSFLEVVAPLRLAVPLGGALGVNVYAGPGIGLAMGCVERFRVENVESIFDCDISDFGLKGWDLTGHLGAGLSYAINPQASILLNGALDQSLVSVATSSNSQDLRHRSWLIQAGVLFLPGP